MDHRLILLVLLSVCASVWSQEDCRAIRPMNNFDEEKVGFENGIIIIRFPWQYT